MKEIFKSAAGIVLMVGLLGLVGTSVYAADARSRATDGDGFYIKINGVGGSSASYQKLSVTPIENCWLTNDRLQSCFIYLDSGVTGFSVVEVDGDKETVFGPSANFKPVENLVEYEPKPKSDFCNGLFEVSNKPFEVSGSGLFYIALDVTTHWMTFTPVKKWNIIGTAVPGGWEPKSLVELSPKFSDDKKSAIFSIDSLAMRPGVFKFRYSDGWKLTIDSIYDNDCMTRGSKVSVSYGGSADSFVLMGDNIPSTYNGIYRVELFWAADKVGHATFTKLKDLPIIDYSNHRIGIFGDAYLLSNGKRANWDFNYGDKELDTNVPVKNGNLYTWTFKGVKLFNNGEFKFRQGHDWTGLAIDFQDIKYWNGNAKGDFVNLDTRLHVKNSGEEVYNISLTIDASTEELSITIDK